MIQTAKSFSEQLNKALTEIDVPVTTRERATILSKMLDIPRQEAFSLLEGHTLPSKELLERIAQELDVDSHWLKGA